jgi:diaminohydroxyphosphoribosylaminopyrimidine deaminase/5-amino-6-(5-phosphoribosylamino)uracil reductase
MKKFYMNLAIELARKGAYHTSPNPMVGAVCVKNGKIISTGYHARFGEFHAERRCLTKELDFKGSELYVNLEPCSHPGKTPPCTDIIIEKGVKKVYISHRDPNPKVDGISILKKHNIDVEIGILKDKAIELNQPFLCNMKKNRPYITLKIATSLDGKIAAENGSSKSISSNAALKFVHILRAESDAILIGSNTAVFDNPMLTVRYGGFEKRIIRVILDSTLKIPLESNLIRTIDSNPLIIFTSENANGEKTGILKDKGVDVKIVAKKDNKLDLNLIVQELYSMGVGKLMVEGGGKIASSFLRDNLVDRIIQEIAIDKILGGSMSYSKDVFYDSPENGRIINSWKTFDLDDNIIIEGIINVYRDN